MCSYLVHVICRLFLVGMGAKQNCVCMAFSHLCASVSDLERLINSVPETRIWLLSPSRPCRASVITYSANGSQIFNFPTLNGEYKVSTTERALIVIPFQLVSTNCDQTSYENIRITLDDNTGSALCHITHRNGQCKVTDVPECRCVKTGSYQFQRVAGLSDSGKWVWLAHGTNPSLRQAVLINVSSSDDSPAPPQIREFSVAGQEMHARTSHNTPVEISCLFDTGNPPANVTILDKTGVEPGSCSRGPTSKPAQGLKTCSIERATCQDSGSYTCKVTGTTTVIKEVSLVVEGPPEVSEPTQRQKKETTVLEFAVCSYTKNMTACFRSSSPAPAQIRSVTQGTGNLSSSGQNCIRFSWTLDGVPPHLTVRIAKQEVTSRGPDWQLTLGNAWGERQVNFSLHSIRDPATETAFSDSKFFTTGSPTEGLTGDRNLLTNTTVITLASNGVVVLAMVILGIGIWTCTSRRRRRSRMSVGQDILMQERLPLPQPQANQAPQNDPVPVPEPTIFLVNRRSEPYSASSTESDIYDKARDEEDDSEGGAVAMGACAFPQDRPTPVLSDDYLHAVASGREKAPSNNITGLYANC